MAIRLCPHCGAIAASRDARICISCGKPLRNEQEVISDDKNESEITPSRNPYQAWTLRFPGKKAGAASFFVEPDNASESFAFPAAFCSISIPIVFIIFRGFALSHFVEYRETPVGSAGFTGFEVVALLAHVAAFLCGLYGLQGGIQRRSFRTILISTVGSLANFYILFVWAKGVISYLTGTDPS